MKIWAVPASKMGLLLLPACCLLSRNTLRACAGHFGPHPSGTVGGIQAGVDTTHAGKVWLVFNALGAIAFAFSFSFILVSPALCLSCCGLSPMEWLLVLQTLAAACVLQTLAAACVLQTLAAACMPRQQCTAPALPLTSQMCWHPSSAVLVVCSPMKCGRGDVVTALSSKCGPVARLYSGCGQCTGPSQPLTFLSLATAAQQSSPPAFPVLLLAELLNCILLREEEELQLHSAAPAACRWRSRTPSSPSPATARPSR